MRRNVLGLALALSLTACAGPRYYFAPVEPTPVTPKGYTGASFAIPEGQSDSFVRFVPVGIVERRGQRVFEARVFFENHGGTPWAMDLRRQQLRYKPDSEPLTALIPAVQLTNPVFQAPKGHSSLTDVDFPVPDSVSGDSSLDVIELDWEVTVASQPVAQHTAFVRAVVPEGPESTSNRQGAAPPRRGMPAH